MAVHGPATVVESSLFQEELNMHECRDVRSGQGALLWLPPNIFEAWRQSLTRLLQMKGRPLPEPRHRQGLAPAIANDGTNVGTGRGPNMAGRTPPSLQPGRGSIPRPGKSGGLSNPAWRTPNAICIGQVSIKQVEGNVQADWCRSLVFQAESGPHRPVCAAAQATGARPRRQEPS